MDKIKFYIESSLIPLTEVRPVTGGDFEFKKESNLLYYRHEAKDKLKFSHPDDWALLQPQIEDECGEVSVYIDRLCQGEYVRYWEGVFTIFDSTIHYGQCWLEVKPDPADDYTCFEKALKSEVNIFTSGGEVTVTAVGGTYETQTCSNLSLTTGCTIFNQAISTPLNDCLTEPSEWCLKENIVLLDGQQVGVCDKEPDEGATVEQTTRWHREVATVDCVGGVPTAPLWGSGWNLLEDDCGGSNTSTWWRCPPISNGTLLGDYTRGRTLEGVLNTLLSQMGCGLSVKSDFFDINALGDAPVNVAYDYAAQYLHHLTLHQKSDIKRPDATQGSTSQAWDLKPKDFFEDLQKIFNVWYIIVDDVLILEHYSFFTSVLGWDLTGESMVLKLDYSGNENVRSEEYFWNEENSNYSFRSKPILYDCGDEDKEVRCSLFSTDISYTQNPDNEDKVSDEGFMLIANALHDGDLILIDNNDPLRWQMLQPALHQHGRLYKSGSINGAPAADFLSWKPYKKQEKFKTDYCCGQTFDPQNLITTSLGNAVVGSATHNIFSNRLEIEPLY